MSDEREVSVLYSCGCTRLVEPGEPLRAVLAPLSAGRRSRCRLHGAVDPVAILNKPAGPAEP